MTDKNPFKIGDRVKWCKKFLAINACYMTTGKPYAKDLGGWSPKLRGVITRLPTNDGSVNEYCVVVQWKSTNYDWPHTIHPHNLTFAED